MTTLNARVGHPLVTVICVSLAVLLVPGCASGPGQSRAAQGAGTGAAIGVGLGLLVGVLSGDADKAARAMAVGAASGAISGGYEGWVQDQEDERTRQITQAIRQIGAQEGDLDSEARQREELTRFLGSWQMQGWVDDEGVRRSVSAKVYGDVQMRQFVELAWIDLKIEGFESQVWGTTMLGYSGGHGYGISTRINTSPDAFEFDRGTFDSSQRAFNFVDAQGDVSIRFATPDRFTVTTTSGGTTVESYTFTRT